MHKLNLFFANANVTYRIKQSKYHITFPFHHTHTIIIQVNTLLQYKLSISNKQHIYREHDEGLTPTKDGGVTSCLDITAFK